MSTNPNQTPLTNESSLAKALGIDQVLIKHEYQNPSGSHKDRAIWPMIDYYKEQGIKHFVISSSGNAAISAAYYFSSPSLSKGETERGSLDVLISPSIPEAKRERLDEIIINFDNINIHESNRAKSDAIKLAKEKDYQLLRTSLDDHALEGYKKLAEELTEQLKESQSELVSDSNSNRSRIESGMTKWDIFIPTSSGTTIQGIYQGLTKEEKSHDIIRANGTMINLPKLHLVQTSKVNVIAREFDSETNSSESSLASAIVDTIAHRKEDVISAVKTSKGSGWIISDQELEEAKKILESNTDMKDPSWDSLLSLAGLTRALDKGQQIKNVILLFTGK